MITKSQHCRAEFFAEGIGWVPVDPADVRKVALEEPAQTEAAHKLCFNIPAEHRTHYLQPAVGHYGVFNGSRFRAEIAPRIADFVLSHDASTVRSAWRRKVAAQA